MTYSDYVRKVYQTLGANKTLRPGQAYFNVLEDVRPELAQKIRGTRFDPFHDDTKLLEFLKTVCILWEPI